MKKQTITTLLLIAASTASLFNATIAEQINYGDCISSANITDFERFIQITLESGGSYTAIKSAKSYGDWATLAGSVLDTIDRDTSKTTSIPMPFGLEFYQLACKNKAIPIYTITPKNSGQITVSVKTYGNFHPYLIINSSFQQQEVDYYTYDATFYGQARQTYQIKINKEITESGLYSIHFDTDYKE